MEVVNPTEDPIALALSNHVILSKIFSLLPVHNLKTARLVNQFWNDMVLAEPVPRLNLRITNFFGCYKLEDTLERCDPDPRLARSITVDQSAWKCICRTHGRNEMMGSAVAYIHHFVKQYGANVETLKITWLVDPLAKRLVEIMLLMPNLRNLKLDLIVCDYTMNKSQDLTVWKKSQKMFLSLRSLVFENVDKCQPSCFTSVVDMIREFSPNLKVVRTLESAESRNRS